MLLCYISVCNQLKLRNHEMLTTMNKMKLEKLSIIRKTYEDIFDNNGAPLRGELTAVLSR